MKMHNASYTKLKAWTNTNFMRQKDDEMKMSLNTESWGKN